MVDMRRTMVLVAIASGCVHRPPLTSIEFCAAQNMVMSGTAFTTGESSDVSTQYGRSPVFSTGESVSRTTQCRRAETRRDACEVRAASESIAVKANFEATGRNLLIGVGWALLVPGLMMTIAFRGQSDDADENAADTFRRTYADCMAGREDRQERHSWWCTNVANDDDGDCTNAEDACIKTRSVLAGDGKTMAACYETTSVECYRRGDGIRCSPTRTACDRHAGVDPNRISGCSETR